MKNGTFSVKTFVRSKQVDLQIVTNIDELISNSFVIFSGTGDLEEFAGEPLDGGTDGTFLLNLRIQESEGEPLEGGTDGTTPVPSEWLPDFLDMANTARWQTMAMPYKDNAISKNILTFINDQRNNQGRYVQAVVCDYLANHEGIINSTMGAVIDGVEVTPAEFTAWVAGVTAGAAINQSNTARIIVGATEIIGELDRAELERAVQSGKFVLSRTQRNEVMVTQDINSFTGFTPNKNYAFSKNRLIRTFDEIGTTTKDIWEQSYMGKANNDETGRAGFKGDLIFYYYSLQNLQGGAAIQNFDGSTDISVEQGNELDSVLVNIFIQPVDSMEKLYKTVNLIA